MESFRSYLSVESNSEDCLLCRNLIRKKDKVSIFKDEGWNTLIEQAERWSKIKIPNENSWFGFTLVYAKVASASGAFGKTHVN